MSVLNPLPPHPFGQGYTQPRHCSLSPHGVSGDHDGAKEGAWHSLLAPRFGGWRILDRSSVGVHWKALASLRVLQ
jgi:hypothetical protein